MDEIPPFSLLKIHDVEIEQVRAQAALLCRVQKCQVQDIYPCTALQEGLLALTAQDPDAYVAQFTYEIQDHVCIDKLQNAWRVVAAANPILRTRIVSIKDRGLLQVVIDEPLTWTSRLNAGSNFSDDPVQDSMTLGNALTKFTILPGADGGPRRLQWDIHHALYDGWSFPLLLEEAERAYFGEPSQSLQPITLLIQYQTRQDAAETKAFWQSQFDNIQGVHFPSSKLVGSSPSPDDSLYLTLPLPSSDTQSDFTIATMIKAAWSLVVAEITQREEVLFGVTVSGRQAPIANIEAMAGPAIATVPIRVKLDWHQSVHELLESVQSQAADMILFEQTGLQRIRRSSQEASLACNFQTLLVIQPAKRDSSTSGSSSSSRSGSLFVDDFSSNDDDGGSQNFQTYPLVIECHPSPTDVNFKFDFDSSVIGRQEVAQAAQSLERIFKRLCDTTQAQSKLNSFAIDDQYRQDIDKIWAWNAVVPDASQACIHDLVIGKARERPEASAIRSWDGELTYHELDSISTRLARQLAKKGVKGTVIPLLFEKSLWMPVTVLAVLKAGAAPVAVDISQPKSRLETIVSSTGSPLILASAHASPLALEVSGPKQEVMIIEKNHSTLDAGDAILPDVSPQDVLYVVFTSGSTGTPKGVVITHQNFASAIAHQQKFVNFNKNSRVLDFASYAFDVAWSNLFNTLTAGGCLCIPSASERQNDLVGCLKRYQINFLDLTPSLARTLGRNALSQLDTLILGGEAAQVGDAFLAGEKTRVYNLYGPAECTPTTTCAQLDGGSANIGKGAGICTWLVNPDRPEELARLGAVGELWVEGPLVGAGYLGSPEQTAEAFVEDPSWLINGPPKQGDRPARPGRHGRLYRTGDLVKYNDDGTLTYVGRKDSQVKIRGQRLELGEVEQYIRQALDALMGPASSSAQVIVDTIRPQGVDNAILVAFLHLRRESDATYTEQSHQEAVQKLLPELTDRLADMLPAFMLPTSFIPVYELPVTVNGKTDMKSLRIYAESQWMQYRDISEGQGAAETLSETEKVLQQVWMTVLNLPREMVSVNKAFMRMGGDSISAMQVVAECRLRNITTTVGDILRSSTIRNLAICCEKTTEKSPETEQEEEDKLDIPFTLSPIQMNFFDAHPNGLNLYNQSFILNFSSTVTSETLHSALLALVSRHPMLRARFLKNESSGIWEQLVTTEGPASFAYSQHYVTTYSAFGRAAQWRQENLDIIDGPVFAADLFHLPEGGTRLLLSAHHLVVDLVSWRIIWQELEEFVELGKLPALATTSFEKWCKRQCRAASTASPLSVLPCSVPEPQFDFWQLRPDQNIYDGMEGYEQVFDADTTDLLFGAANDALKTEPSDIIVGALAYSFLHTFPERSLPALWVEGHGREPLGDNVVDVSRTVGWFTTILPLVVSLSTTDSVDHAIRLAKDAKRAIPGKGRPYFACRYHSDSGREAFNDHGDVVEVQFNFTGRFQQLEKDESLFKEDEIDYDKGDEFNLALISSSAPRSAFIDITAGVHADSLSVTFEIHRLMRHQDRLMQWMDSFNTTLESIVKSLNKRKNLTTLTLSDLPLLSLSYNGLDMLLNEQIPAIGLQSKDIKEAYPCSPLQEGMLLSQAKESASYATYSIWECATAVGSTPALCPRRLEIAWKTVVSRHPILSSIFLLHPEGQGFIQLELHSPLIEVIQTSTQLEEPGEVLEGVGKPEFASNRPGHRFTICQSHTGQVACRLDIGHAYYDAASAGILLEEVAMAYDDCELPPAPSFRRVVEHINSTTKLQRIDQWTELLGGVKPCLFPLLTLHEDEITESYGEVPILADLGPTILAFCKKMHITHSVFFQIIWAMVLSHFTGSEDVCFGSLTSGRDISMHGIDKIVGPVAAMLICRIDLRKSLPKVLKQTMQNSTKHFAIQQTSLADIQHKLGFSGQQMFNTSLSIQGHARKEKTEERSISLETRDSGDAHEFDLSLNVRIGSENIDAFVSFKESTVTFETAKEVSDVLNQASELLLKFFNQHLAESLSREMFKYSTGTDEAEAAAFWKAQFLGTEGTCFPPLSNQIKYTRTNSVEKLIVESFRFERADIPPAVLIRAAWAVLSARTLNVAESVFGISDSETPFLVPVRIIPDGTSTVDEYLQGVSTQLAEISKYQRTGLRRIRRFNQDTELGCEFQTLIREIDESHPLIPVRNDKVDGRALVLDFEIQSDNALNFKIHFDDRVVDRPQAHRLLRQLETAMRRLSDPTLGQKRLGDVHLTSLNDIQEIWEWNSSVPEPVDACVHNLVLSRVRENGDALAVSAWDGDCTYSQLDELSTTLAHRLANAGVRTGDAVAVCLNKSKWTTVAVLAVMKSGGVCLLVDPSTQPEDRISYFAQRVQAKVMVSTNAHENIARKISLGSIIVGSSEPNGLQLHNSELPNVRSTDLAYIVFTSGSTGQPKGIMISHANACSAVAHQADVLGYSKSSRVLDFASYAFDAAWWNLLLSVTVGGCLCVPSLQERDDIAYCIEKYEVTALDIIPSVARHVEPQSALSRLSTLVLAGEAVLPTDSELADKQTTRTWNVYGPAECTPTATLQNISHTDNKGIGRGAGLCTWVVDPDNVNMLASIGAVGELCLEGPLVGQGYINDPEKTRTAFVKDPDWLIRGTDGANEHLGRTGKVYRTGDLVRYNSDGSLEFLGRKDTQIKIRGQRVELGEIEHHIRQAVEESVRISGVQVVAEYVKLADSDRKSLVAFVALENAVEEDEEYAHAVREATSRVPGLLEASVPPYMIPQVFLPLRSIPHTPSGKIDRRHLNAQASFLAAKEMASQQDRLAHHGGGKRQPKTEAEATLQALWADVLQTEAVDEIGAGDSFFRLGGDSIRAMQLVMKARQHGVTLAVREIFQKPILTDLAALVSMRAPGPKN